MGALQVFRRPIPAAATVGLTILLSYVYFWFDLRAAGAATNVLTTKQTTPEMTIHNFGVGFYFGAVILDVLLALVASVLIVLAFVNYCARRRAAAASCAVGTSTGLGLAVATFGCPSCPVPIAGTLGASFFATSVPFLGLEFKVLSLVVTVAVLIWSMRRLANVDLVGSGAVLKGSSSPA